MPRRLPAASLELRASSFMLQASSLGIVLRVLAEATLCVVYELEQLFSFSFYFLSGRLKATSSSRLMLSVLARGSRLGASFMHMLFIFKNGD